VLRYNILNTSKTFHAILVTYLMDFLYYLLAFSVYIDIYCAAPQLGLYMST